MAQLQFYKKSTTPDANEGSVWFDSSNHKIKLKTESGWETFNGVQSAGTINTPIYIDENGDAQEINTERFVKNNDVIQRENAFVNAGGGICIRITQCVFWRTY